MSGGRLTAEVDDRLDLVARGALLYFHLHQGSLSLGHFNQPAIVHLSHTTWAAAAPTWPWPACALGISASRIHGPGTN